MPTCTCIYYSWSIQMSTWKVSVYGDCLPLSHLSHHRRLDSPAPKYNQSWCPDEHVGSIVYGDYPPPDALLVLSQHRWQPVPAPTPPHPPPPPPQNIYHPTNHDVLQDLIRKITCNKIIQNSKFNLQLGKIAVKVTKNCRVWPWPSTKFQLIKKAYPCWL